MSNRHRTRFLKLFLSPTLLQVIKDILYQKASVPALHVDNIQGIPRKGLLWKFFARSAKKSPNFIYVLWTTIEEYLRNYLITIFAHPAG